MKKNFLFRLLCVTLLAGMVFVSCKRENVTTGKYTVTVVSANEQMGKAYGGGQFDAGATVRIWGTPEIGYQFERWNDGNTDNPRNITRPLVPAPTPLAAAVITLVISLLLLLWTAPPITALPL